MVSEVIEHQAASGERAPSKGSLRGLDSVNFLMADVTGGLGPYLSVFLKGSRHWQAGDIGIAMAASSIAAACCQIPAGMLVDASRRKRAMVAVAGVLIAVGCVVIGVSHGFAPVIAAQVALGVASTVVGPALAAISLGLVGRRRMDARVSRNQSFNSGGNFTAAILAGTLGQYLGFDWVFYLVCGFAVASALAVRLINPREIDHDLARGGEDRPYDGGPLPLRDLLRRRDLLVFLGTVILFHFGNAAMLPMAGQELAVHHPGSAVIAQSACIIAAQAVMIGVAWVVGQAMARGIGRKPIFVVALCILPIRGLLFTQADGPIPVVAIQLLDGVGAGIFGVIAVVIASDLMRGTGRFNLAQGLVALCVGIGATCSNLLGGFVVQAAGYPAGFLTLAVIACVGVAFFWTMMPETRPADDTGGIGPAQA